MSRPALRGTRGDDGDRGAAAVLDQAPQTRGVRANGTACMRSIASPSALRWFASTSRISDASPDSRSPRRTSSRRPRAHDGDAGRVGAKGERIERLRSGHVTR